MPPLSDRLIELGRIMDLAANVVQEARKELKMELKKDVSIVTNADRATETFLRNELIQSWPGTTFWGEEFGRESAGEKGIWLIDPIDGTSNFNFGSPLWGISVALAVGSKIEVGAVWLPDLNETYIAEAGAGAFKDGMPMAPINPGPVQPFELVSFCESVPRAYPNQKIPGKMRCAGAFVIDGMFTATQRYRGLIGRGERIYDAAASMLICEELGADIRNADGTELEMEAHIAGKPFEKAWLIFPPESGFNLVEPS